MFGAGVRPLVFTEGKFLAVLRNSNFAERKVSAGPVIVAAPPFSEQTERNSVYAALDQYFPPNLRWPVCKGDVKKPSCSWQGVVDDPKEEIHGCPKLDWKRLDLASGEDIVLCYKELYSTSAALDNYLDPNRKFKEMILGIAIPGFMGRNLMMDAASIPGGDFSQWLQMCGPDLFQKHTTEDAKEAGSNSKRGAKTEAWNSCKNAVDAGVLSLTANKRILVNTEAGKTYYVRWSVGHFGAGGELELVDEATGAKEMKGLHPAEDK